MFRSDTHSGRVDRTAVAAYNRYPERGTAPTTLKRFPMGTSALILEHLVDKDMCTHSLF
jgi:hypothetical protein